MAWCIVYQIGLEFWPDYQQAAGAFCMGEVWVEDNVPFVARYQTQGQLDAVFHFPLHNALKKVFIHAGSFSVLRDVIEESVSQLEISLRAGIRLFHSNVCESARRTSTTGVIERSVSQLKVQAPRVL